MSEARSGRMRNRLTRGALIASGVFLAGVALSACASGSAEPVKPSLKPIALAPVVTFNANPTFDCEFSSTITGDSPSSKDSLGVTISSRQYTLKLPEVTVTWGDGKTSVEDPYYSSDEIYHTYTAAGHFLVSATMTVPGQRKPIPCTSGFGVNINPSLSPLQSIQVTS